MSLTHQLDDCELCPELAGGREHRYGDLYGPAALSRIGRRSEHFAAMPTLGQLFVGSTLVMPLAHIETLAATPPRWWSELAGFVAEVEAAVCGGGPSIVFEHGSTRQNAGACGIYHAHLHVVPVPERLTAEELLQRTSVTTNGLLATLSHLQTSGHYAWARGTNGQFGALDLSHAERPLPSQHLRRVLAAHFNLNREWDWRTYDFVEQDVLTARDLLLT